MSALIASGVDVNEPQVDGATALHWAVRWDNIVMARELLEAGADPNVINRVGAVPMLLASVSGSAEMISMLLEAGASANQALTITGDTPLMIAARTGNSESVRVLLDAGADVHAQETWWRHGTHVGSSGRAFGCGRDAHFSGCRCQCTHLPDTTKYGPGPAI